MQESGQTTLFAEGYRRLDLLLQLEPNNSKAHFTAALIKTDMKEYDKAKHHFEEALKVRNKARMLGMPAIFVLYIYKYQLIE